jgi:hypothetical protein
MRLNHVKVLLAAAALVAAPAARADSLKKEMRQMLGIENLSKDLKKHVGHTVTVRGEIDDVLSDRMITLDDDALVGGHDVLVLLPAGMGTGLMKDQEVVVTGTVRRFVRADLDRDYDFFDDGKLVAVTEKVDWDSRPVIVATEVHTAASADAGTRSDGTVTTITASGLARIPEPYYGREVTVRSEVEDVLSPYMFTLDEDTMLSGADVLVLVPRGITGSLRHDQKVVVTGEVRRYREQDLDRDFSFFERGRLVTVREKVDWNTRPVLVARSIRTEAGVEVATQ